MVQLFLSKSRDGMTHKSSNVTFVCYFAPNSFIGARVACHFFYYSFFFQFQMNSILVSQALFYDSGRLFAIMIKK